MSKTKLIKEIRAGGNKEFADHYLRFFKTGPGEYGEGDKFVGMRVPQVRRISKAYYDLPLSDIRTLLQNPIHEIRFAALLLLIRYYEKVDEREAFDLFCRERSFVNNWDLVDLAAPRIVGPYLKDKPKKILYEWASSKDLWERRIAIMATFAFIKDEDYKLTLDLAKNLLQDEEDLIHKAVGWMIREVGNRDRKTMTDFLDANCRYMPRTMLRYAIEKLPATKRKAYLNKA